MTCNKTEMTIIIDALWKNRDLGPLSAAQLGVKSVYIKEAARLGIAKASVDEKTRYTTSPLRLYEWDRFFLQRNPALSKCLFDKCVMNRVQTGLFSTTTQSRGLCCNNGGYLDYTIRRC